MTKDIRFKGCIYGGIIGDAWGSGYENIPKTREDIYYLFGQPKKDEPIWGITDDTQFTIATIEAMIETDVLTPEMLADKFLIYYKKRKFTGLGSSVLKSLKDLSLGIHWSQAGRKGEFAASNGAAMRVAPLAFHHKISREDIYNFCKITHYNDEAYTGALCIYIALKKIINGMWSGNENLIELIIKDIPDTRVRDRLTEIKDEADLDKVGEKGNNGYIVNSIPLALAAANQVRKIGIESMFSKLIEIGGDTDTNCSIAGQIAGALIGVNAIPNHLIDKISILNEFDWINTTIEHFTTKMHWR